MKRVLFCFLIFFQFMCFGGVQASTDLEEVILFYSKTCSHCHEEIVFLENLKKENPDLHVTYFEISIEKNKELWRQYQEKYNVKGGGVPLTIVGDEYFLGFGSKDTTGELIKRAINIEDVSEELDEKYVSIPFFGKIDYKNFSLPVLAVVLGGLDGFNPCAMWVLIFLIGLLLGMNDRKRMWILGGAFIVSSAFVYFLFMVAWLNFFLFVGMIAWVRIAIAVVALGSGIYYLYDYITNPEATCKVSKGKNTQKVFERLRRVVGQKQFWFALIGIIVLAWAVNLVELVCSAGLPAVFTQVLTLSELPAWEYYLYVLLYIFFFMLDDLIVFFVAMMTLNTMGISGKYSRISRIVGGILMIALGLMLAFKPSWIMF